MATVRAELTVTHEDRAFDILVMRPEETGNVWREWGWVPGAELEPASQVRSVSVYPPANPGVVRGPLRTYWLIDGALWLRTPCYTGEWPAMDAAVAAALGARLDGERHA